MPPLSQPLVTLLLVVATAMVQLFAQYVAGRLTDALPRMWLTKGSPSHRMAVTVTAIVILMLEQLCEVLIWALRYYHGERSAASSPRSISHWRASRQLARANSCCRPSTGW